MRAFAFLAGWALAGCGESYELTVEMRPAGDGLARTIRGEKRDKGFPDEVRRIIAERYASAGASSASDVFAGELPAEFGGSGFHRRFESELGSASIYSERLQPARSAWEVVEAIEAAGDRCIDLWLGWLRWELAELPEFAAFADRVEADVRAWLKNEALLFALPQTSGPRTGFVDVPGLPLAVHELLETGFLSLQDLPHLYNITQPEHWALSRLRSLFAEALDVPVQHDALAFLASPAAFVGSWRAWIEAGGAADVADAPDAGSDPGEACEQLFELANFDFDLFGSQTRVAVTLETSVEPLEANGNFDAASGKLHWPAEDVEDDVYRPLHRYAIWATPDEETQRRLFGRVPLRGKELFEYALWRGGLGEAEATEWSERLASLDPDRDLAEQLGELRLRSRPDRPDEAPHGAKLLIQALGSD